MRGAEKQERGLLIQSVEDLLNLIEISYENVSSPKKNQKKSNFNEKKFQLLSSVYCVYKNEIFDLLSKQKIKVFIEKFSLNLTLSYNIAGIE